MDITAADMKKYIGQHIDTLPTPSLILSEPILRENCKRMLEDVAAMGVKFRPHVKTLKVCILLHSSLLVV